MGIGTGIFLVAVGAILTFAVNVSVGWLDLRLVGEILMLAGIVVAGISLILMLRKRSSVSTTKAVVDPATGEGVTERRSEIQ